MGGHYLITGGAGFIGSHLVDLLLAEGQRATVVDDFSSGKRENLPRDPRCAILETDVLALTADQLPRDLDGVVHLAALPSVTASWSDVGRSHEMNLGATLRMIELARAMGISRIVYASSAAVYGNPSGSVVFEDDPTWPISPYGLQKLAGEHYGRLFASAALRFVALRFFNVFGPRQVATSPYSGVISKFAARMGAGQPITLDGGGAQTRDFIYVKDIARGILAALRAETPTPYTVCNLGTGRAISIRQLAEAMRERFPSWSAGIESGPALPGDIQHSQADIARAQRLLGFQPAFSLAAGLAEMTLAD